MNDKKDIPAISAHEYLEIKDNRNKLNSRLGYLRLINDEYRKGENPTEQTIAIKYFKDQYPLNGTEDEKKRFIQCKVSTLSRSFVFLKKEPNPLIMKYYPMKKVEGSPIKLTPLGEAILHYPDIDRVVNEKGKLPPLNEDIKRRFHNNEIRDLLEQILNELGIVASDKYYDYEMNVGSKLFTINNANYRTDRLYEDLKNHIGMYIKFDDIDERLLEYKTHFIKSVNKRGYMIDKLIRHLEYKLKLNWTDRSNTNTFNMNLIDFIIEGFECLSQERYEKFFESDYIEFDHDAEYVDHDMVQRAMIRIKGSHVANISQKNNIDKRYQGFVSRLQSVIRTIKQSEYYEMYIESIEEQEIADRIITLLIQDLSKERDMISYPGYCKYVK